MEQLRKLDGLELTESTVDPVLTRLARDGLLAVRTDRCIPGGHPRARPKGAWAVAGIVTSSLALMTDRPRMIAAPVSAFIFPVL